MHMNVLPAQYMGSPGAHGVQKRASDFLEMELSEVASFHVGVGIKPKSSTEIT